MTSSIRSILLGSTDPERLRGWYVDAFALEPDADGFLQLGGVGMLVDRRDDVAGRTAEPGRVVLNHHVPSIHTAAEHLDRGGATWVAPVEYRDAGLWFGTVEDPDGNYVQLIETTPEYWRLKRERAGGTAGPLESAEAEVRLPAQDLGRAREWYARVLGLAPAEEREGGLRYHCGGTTFCLFASTGAPSGTHTQMSLSVPDLDLVLTALRERGLELEGDVVEVEGHYPSSGARGERAAWFRDSEGNLIGLGQLVF
jgi:predicted enzyme related to lactoylglutathione lyase